MFVYGYVVVCVQVVLIQMVCGHTADWDHGVALPTTRPLIIAHRGACGLYPESSGQAYKQAIVDGADVLECDVFITKDLKPICIHDPYLSYVTDVADHPEFADRKHKLSVPDYGEKDDWFCFDFTLEELKTLKLKQRESFRDQNYNGLYDIPTLQELIWIVKNASRPVGIYPEIKIPEMINLLDILNGTRMEDIILDVLVANGYTKKTDPCFIQSFNIDSLKYVMDKTELPLVALAWRPDHILGPALNESKIQEWGELFYGVGLWKIQVVDYYDDVNYYKNKIKGELALLQECRDAGLKVHLYTFRNEDKFLAWDFHQDPISEYLYFNKMKIDGFFTDFPGTMKRAFDLEYGERVVEETQPMACTDGSPSWVASGGVILLVSTITYSLMS